METLRKVLAVLEPILIHMPGGTNATRVYSPDASDMSEQAELKRKLIKQSLDVLDAGKAKLNGRHAGRIDIFSTQESDEIVRVLADDPEGRDFQELVHHATVAQSLINEAS
jgi:hypothetical protein